MVLVSYFAFLVYLSSPMPAWGCICSNGTSITKVVPSPLLSTWMVACMSSNFFLTTESPKPVPVCFVVKNGSNIFCRESCGMPCPVSVTFIWIKCFVGMRSASMEIFPLGGVAWMALWIRLKNTSFNAALSAYISGSASEILHNIAILFCLASWFRKVNDTLTCYNLCMFEK